MEWTKEQQQALNWAIKQSFPSVAATYAKILAEMIIQLEAENGWRTTLQDRIFEWGRETFGPGQRSGGVFAHLVREIKELGKSMPEIDPDELADCAILLFELAGFAGVQLLDEVDKKFAINRERKWGAIEADGSILHIEGEGER